jgi:hypothetical protein
MDSVMKYDGKAALSKTYSEMGFAGHNAEISTALTKDAVQALGLEIAGNSKYTVDEKIAIVEWVRLNKRLPDGRFPAKKRSTTKRDKAFDGFTRIAFNIKSNPKRQHVSLESEYVTALDKIAPDSRNKWLSETVDAYIQEHGDESTTRIIKLAIVNKLMERW